MAKDEKKSLTRLELRIMQVLWRDGAGTVADVQQRLGSQLAYTTVQTMLNILERKGKAKRKLQGKAYLYSASVTEAKALREAVRDLVDRMFSGSSEDLVMSMVQSRQIDAKRLAELSRKLQEQEEQ